MKQKQSDGGINIFLLLSISSDGWQIHCSPTYIIDFLDLELCYVIYTQYNLNRVIYPLCTSVIIHIYSC